MGFLAEKYGLTAHQEESLFNDGVVSLSFVTAWDIWTHYNSVKDNFKLKEDAVFDCQIHFKLSRNTIYKALRLCRA